MWSDLTYLLCFGAGFYPKVYCLTDEFLVKVQLVASGAAVAILLESCLADAMAVAPGLAYGALDRYDTARTIDLMRRKNPLLQMRRWISGILYWITTICLRTMRNSPWKARSGDARSAPYRPILKAQSVPRGLLLAAEGIGKGTY